ncbi:MAG: DMT family transporter, partial [Pseudomonadota bacterium]
MALLTVVSSVMASSMLNGVNNKWFPYVVMSVGPAFFSTNLIFGRYVAPETDPFVLAFIRWLLVAVILLAFAIQADSKSLRSIVRKQWPFFIFIAFLGMGISGSGVYLGLQYTTASNATLIYSITPILIILIERVLIGRKSNLREAVGIVLALLGVATIVLKGNLATLLQLDLNPGDLLIALAALSWAGYSILYRSDRVSGLTSLILFSAIALFGALVNLPGAAYAMWNGAGLPNSGGAWLAVAGIVLISSLVAFSTFQYGVRALGASTAG